MHAKYVLDAILGLKGISCISLENSVYSKHLSAREKGDLRSHDQIQNHQNSQQFLIVFNVLSQELGKLHLETLTII